MFNFTDEAVLEVLKVNLRIEKNKSEDKGVFDKGYLLKRNLLKRN